MRTMGIIGGACVLAIGLLLAGGCGGATGKAAGLKGHWAFDEAAGDLVKNAAGPNDGRIQGGLKRADGKQGKAIAFDGKGYVLIAHAACLNAPQYTFVAWVKLKDTGEHHYIAWRGGPEFPEDKECRSIDLWLTTDGRLSGYFDIQAGGSRPQLEGAKKVADDLWHLVACVADGKKITFYVDGAKDGEVTLDGSLAKSEFPLWIGARPGDVAATGLIDEVRFFDRALAPAEIAELK